MVRSEFAKKVDQIQSEARKLLKKLDYRKRGHTFNRILDSGLIHVINFQMGQYPVGNHIDIPPFRLNLYGYFTVNLGVFIPEVHTMTRGQGIPKFVQEYDCEIRKRIGHLLTPPKDVWWDLAVNTEELSATVLDSLKERGLPYLERFLSHDDIIREWKEHWQSIGLPPRAGLSVAIMLASQGQVDQAKHLLQQEYEREKNKPYSAFVKEIAQRMGTTVLG